MTVCIFTSRLLQRKGNILASTKVRTLFAPKSSIVVCDQPQRRRARCDVCVVIGITGVRRRERCFRRKTSIPNELGYTQICPHPQVIPLLCMADTGVVDESKLVVKGQRAEWSQEAR